LAMKILVFSDAHGSRRVVDIAKTLTKTENAEMIVYLGDYSDNKYIGDVDRNLTVGDYFVRALGEKNFKSLFGK